MNKQLFFPIFLLTTLVSTQTTQASSFLAALRLPRTEAVAAPVAVEVPAIEVPATTVTPEVTKGYGARFVEGTKAIAGQAKDKAVAGLTAAGTFVAEHSKALTVGTVALGSAYLGYKAYNRFVNEGDSKTRKVAKASGIVAAAALPVAGTFFKFNALSSLTGKVVDFVSPIASKATSAVTEFVSNNPKLSVGIVAGAALITYLGRRGYNAYCRNASNLSPEKHASALTVYSNLIEFCRQSGGVKVEGGKVVIKNMAQETQANDFSIEVQSMFNEIVSLAHALNTQSTNLDVSAPKARINALNIAFAEKIGVKVQTIACAA